MIANKCKGRFRECNYLILSMSVGAATVRRLISLERIATILIYYNFSSKDGKKFCLQCWNMPIFYILHQCKVNIWVLDKMLHL